jgi:cytochrome P450
LKGNNSLMSMTLTHNLPPGSTMPPLLRRIKFVAQPVKYVEDFGKVYGDNFTVWGRNSPLIYFSHPKALEQIFTADPSYFKVGRGNIGLKFLVGDRSILLLDGTEHYRQKQLLTPAFHGERMRTHGYEIQEITQQVTQQWQMGKPFNIRNSIQEITLRVILRVVFGLDQGEMYEKLQRSLTSLLDFMSSSIMSAIFFFKIIQKDLGAWSPWGRILRQKNHIDELIYNLIQQHRSESNQHRQDILSLMMAAKDQNGEGMSDQELSNELITLLIAGHETSASAVTWILYWLDQLPEVKAKLLQELATLGDNTDPSLMTKLPYLTAVCQETLRIYPVTMGGLVRIVKKPIEIMGYQVPVGASIIPSIYLAHHREEVYPQSKQFKPERFLERQYSPYEYLPFGGGNRRCIGSAFALYEIKIIAATILSQFQLSLLNKSPVMPVRRGLTLAAPAGMKMIAITR